MEVRGLRAWAFVFCPARRRSLVLVFSLVLVKVKVGALASVCGRGKANSPGPAIETYRGIRAGVGGECVN